VPGGVAKTFVPVRGRLRSRALRARALAKAGFNPGEPRDDHGRWTSDGGDSGSAPTSSGYRVGNDNLLVPVQFRPPTVTEAIRGLKPELPPKPPSSPKLLVPEEPEPVPPVQKPEPQSENSSPPEKPETSTEDNNNDFEVPPERPEGKDQTPYSWGRKVSDAISEAISAGNSTAAQAIAAAADGATWLARQIPSIISSFDPPKDLHDLQDAALDKSSHPGYEDHHIVEQGPQNDDLGPTDQERIDADDNIIRIPYYAHRDITRYYQTPNEDLDGLTPRQYLREKTFEERYKFGLDTLKRFGVLRR
jgi:hypothetical protein